MMFADLKPYAQYRDSGCPWIGWAPGHWSVKTPPHIGWLMKGSGGSKDDAVSLGIPCVRYGDLYTKHSGFVRSANTCVSPERASVYTPVIYGDVLFAASGESLQEIGKSAVNLISSHAVCGGDVIVLRPKIPVHAPFLGYAMDAHPSVVQKSLMGRGTTVKHIYPSELKGLRVAWPPVEEQAAIVRFLDWATNRLDRAIRAKRKVIALLNEQKQAIIHRAVTRGLDPSVPLKESGVPWLGEIPKHWEVRRLRSVLARNDGGVWGSDFTPDGTIVLRSTEQAMDGTWQIHDPAVIRLSDGKVKSSLLEVGDIVVTKSSGSRSHIGKSSLVTREIAEMRCCYSNFMQRLRAAHELAPEYLNLFLNSKTGRMHYQYSSTSTTGLGNLTRDTIATLPITVPDRSEQARVVDGVRQRLEPINEAISRLEREITLLREYRTRLVADVVTGKLDVRDAAARLPDEAPLAAATASPDPDDDTLDPDDLPETEGDA